MKLSDYIVESLKRNGIDTVFLVTGGGAMHLNDSFGREPSMRCICNHHEQASAMAAEVFARLQGRPAVVNVTTGPGALNALNGVFGAWTDSIPMLVISGQVKRETLMSTYNVPGLRQLGDQEASVLSMVRPITKYAALVDDPAAIRYHLERGIHLAVAGRPGPCWLDIPVDVQNAQIDPDGLRAYDATEDPPAGDVAKIPEIAQEILQRLKRAKHPVILAGTGVRLAHAEDLFECVIRRLRVPVTTAWTHDLIASDDELFCGRPGTIGERAGNFVVQNSDLVLILGSRLNIRQVSYNWSSFAPRATKIWVDADFAELNKPTVRPDLPVHSDLRLFLDALHNAIHDSGYSPCHESWLAWSREKVAAYPVVQDRQRTEDRINPYHFIEILFGLLAADDVVVCGNASACIMPYQAGRIQRGQRLISNSGAASMGHDLPAAIGAAVARRGRRVVCLAGDGSMQFNIQELQTIVHHQFPIKIFVLNNGGYLSIRLTQSNFFNRLTGADASSGVSLPDYTRVAQAYGIPSRRIEAPSEFGSISDFLRQPGPGLCDVVLDPQQEFEPRIKSKQLPDGTMSTPALHDMYPFLEPDELKRNMI